MANRIVDKVKKKPGWLAEIISKHEEKIARRDLMADAITELNQYNTFLDSAEAVKKLLTEEPNEGIDDMKNQMKNEKVIEENNKKGYTLPEIRAVMREDLDMRYRKIKAVSVHGNSEKNRVLRQQFAKHYIEALSTGKIILNVDETWLGMSDFRRMKWQVPGTSNSVGKLQMTPRISGCRLPSPELLSVAFRCFPWPRLYMLPSGATLARQCREEGGATASTGAQEGLRMGRTRRVCRGARPGSPAKSGRRRGC